MRSPIRVLVVDDSALIRQILTHALALDPRIEVVGLARTGVEALTKVRELQPDVVTLDIEMPELTGLEILPYIMRESDARVVMLSSLDDPDTTYAALDAGAVDFITKPKGGVASSSSEVADQLVKKVKTAYRIPPDKRKLAALDRVAVSPAASKGPTAPRDRLSRRLVVIAASTGGPPALERVFDGLTADVPAAYLVVQHLPAGFTASLARRLARIAGFRVIEAAPNMKVEPGHAYLAPHGTHMVVNGRPGKPTTLQMEDSPSVHGVRPAADPLFKSAAAAYGENVTGVVLTGMGRDGAAGLAAVRAAGGRTVVQDEATSVVWGMPGAAVQLGAAQAVVPIDKVAAEIRRSVREGELMSVSDDMDAYRDVFVSESAEYLQSIVDGMLQLESNPNDLEPVETVFRGAHSLKGMAAAMGYERTADLTHKMESLMDTVRRRAALPDHALVDLMLRAADTVKALIEDEMGGTSAVDASPMIEELSAGCLAVAEREEAGDPAPPGGSEAPAPAGEHGLVQVVRVTLEDTCVLKSVRAYMVIKRLSHMGQIVETHPSARDLEDENFEATFEVVLSTSESAEDVSRAAAAVSEVAQVDVERSATTAPQTAATADKDTAFGKLVKAVPKISETQTVRIAIGHIDTMVNLVGELVIMRSRLENLVGRSGDIPVLESLEELHRISSELQHEVMQTRMVPVGNIFNRFPRMVRDLAQDLGKDVAFEMDGLDIELDRTVLDEIGDPLVHLLRNAIDHGIEPAEDRVAAGKGRRGTIRLSASRERDQVRLAVADDGRGMDAERIWSKAVERGLIAPEQRDTCSEEDILLFTCRPGFSTVEVPTRVSGRGVGMDVVRGKIEYLGGSLSIRSTPGEGTEFTLDLPLTLAIIQALLVSADGQMFALPLSFVTEVFSVGDVDVDTVDGAPIVSLRDGSMAPLYRLDALIGACDEPTRPPGDGEHVVLVEVGDQARALTVNELIGRQEVVIKPLAKMLKHIKGLAGATVLGDGSVALILDPRLLFTMGDEKA